MARQKKEQNLEDSAKNFLDILSPLTVNELTEVPPKEDQDRPSQRSFILPTPHIISVSPEEWKSLQCRYGLTQAAVKPSEHSLEEAMERYGSFSDAGLDANAALDYGNWWHHTMESIPWSSGPEPVARYLDQCLEAARATPYSHRAQVELEQFVHSALYAELMEEELLGAAEMPFTRKTEEGAIQDGYLDLVYLDKNQCAHIVDWKTDYFGGQKSPSSETIQQAVDYYSGQLQTYCTTLESAGYSVDRVMIYFTALGKTVEINHL